MSQLSNPPPKVVKRKTQNVAAIFDPCLYVVVLFPQPHKHWVFRKFAKAISEVFLIVAQFSTTRGVADRKF